MLNQRAVVKLLADRMTSSEAILTGSVRIEGGKPEPSLQLRSSMRGVNGAASAALMQLWAVDSPDERAVRLSSAHQLLKFSTDGPMNDMSLITGWAGIGIVASIIGNGGSKYREVRQRIVELISAEVLSSVNPKVLKTSEQFELLRGSAGLYLALDFDTGRQATLKLLDLFDWLSDGDVSRWCLPHSEFGEELVTKPMNRLGVSHGIAGILGALCCRPNVVQSRTLIQRIANLILNYREETLFGPQWSYAVGHQVSTASFRPSWCHFSLGIAAVIAAAGLILSDDAFITHACLSATGLIKMFEQRWNEMDASLCHGVAGSAILFRYIGIVANNVELVSNSVYLTEKLLQSFQLDKKYGFEVPIINRGLVSECSFLTGSIGIGLSLATLGTTPNFNWLRLLGIPPLAYVEANKGSFELAVSFQN